MKYKITPEQLESCRVALATNFDIPALDILQIHANKAGVPWRAFRIRLEEFQNNHESGYSLLGSLLPLAVMAGVVLAVSVTLAPFVAQLQNVR